MFTLAQIVLIATLFISLSFESQEIENLKENVTQSIAEVGKTKENKHVLESKTNINSGNRNKSVSIPNVAKASGLPSLNPLAVATSTSNLTAVNFSRAPNSTATFSTTPPLIFGLVSKLPLNSSLADKDVQPVSAHPNSTRHIFSEDFGRPSDNGTVYFPNQSSTATSVLPSTPTSQSGAPWTTEPTAQPTTDDGSFAGFTPYQEDTTPQPTLQFTNNSKLFPSTSDSPKENRNTGMVFGAILGGILGVSLLSLVGYLLCGKQKTDSFSHQRLYDDRNEPVLRLDNVPELYDVGFGSPSYCHPSVNGRSVPQGQESAQDSIPMDSIPMDSAG